MEPSGRDRDLTLLLQRVSGGDTAARADLFGALYPELRRIAELRMRSERDDHTLQSTALVNEFFLQMARQRDFLWRDRQHFLAVASQAMRCLLIDYARAHKAQRRGGGLKLWIDDFDMAGRDPVDVLVINDLLAKLAAEEPRMARVVEFRCFGGLSNGEIAEILEIDDRTVRRDWQVARAWLRGQLMR
jgi:RNA polymerase sigma factor (TIGR02999 family)